MLHRDSTTRTYTRPDAPAPRTSSTQHRRGRPPAHLRGDRPCGRASGVRPLVSRPVQVSRRRPRSLPARHLRRRDPRTGADVRRLQSRKGMAAPALGSDRHRHHPIAALVYGLHTVFVVRPVAMVFEVDRLRLVTASDVPAEDLLLARPPYDRLSWTGPSLLGARAPVPGPEHTDALFKALRAPTSAVGRSSGSPTSSRSPPRWRVPVPSRCC